MPTRDDDIVKVKRKEGWGPTAIVRFSVDQPDIPTCECHPATEGNPYRTVHEGQIVLMRRAEVAGWRDADNSFHAGRADFELVIDEPAAKPVKPVRDASAAPEPATPSI